MIKNFLCSHFRLKSIHLILFFSVFFLPNCKKAGPEGKKSLIDLINEPAGVNCTNGGYKILSGVDLNRNNVLEESEVQNSKYVCNGSNGSNSLTALITEPAGANCSTGGYKLNTGVDLNNNGTLDASEVQSSQYICNGLTGSNSLVDLAAESAGVNCSNGGYKVNTGVDLNKNGILEDTEVQKTTFICNGDNGLNYLISVKIESAGANCPFGGYNFNTGVDVNKNGILENTEVTNTEYICNNAPLSEIRLPLDFSANTTNTEGVTGLALANFNKANYPGMASIVFVARPYSSGSDNKSIVELVNMTDNQVWTESRLISDKILSQQLPITSQNLFNVIPNKTINIGLRLRSENEGKLAAVYADSYLVLSP